MKRLILNSLSQFTGGIIVTDKNICVLAKHHTSWSELFPIAKIIKQRHQCINPVMIISNDAVAQYIPECEKNEIDYIFIDYHGIPQENNQHFSKEIFRYKILKSTSIQKFKHMNFIFKIL